MGSTYPFLTELEAEFQTAIKKAGWSFESELKFSRPPQGVSGDLATSCALVIAQQQQAQPREIARQLIESINLTNHKYITKLEVVGPGFINFELTTAAWSEILEDSLAEPITKPTSADSQRVVVDYSGPNIGKPFSVGHLRSTIIGDAVARLHEAQQDYVIRVNHLGDWGTQFGKLIVAVRQWGDKQAIDQNPTAELQRLYVKFHEEAKTDTKLDDEARDWFKRLEDGDSEAQKRWRELVDWSLPEYDRIYELLGVSFTDPNVPESGAKGESYYTKERLAEVLAELKAKELVRTSEGAEVLALKQHDLPETVLVRTDGASVYLLRDLAALKYRLTTWLADRVIYHIGVEQKLHLQQLFATAVELGWLKTDEAATDRLVAALHGHYRLPEGKMSSRQGRGIYLNDLIEQGITLARQVLKVKNPSLTTTAADQLAQEVALGAIKYNDLSHNRESDIIFDWGRALNLEGNSAPYLMYTNARLHGLRRKATTTQMDSISVKQAVPLLKQERSLLLAFFDLKRSQHEATIKAMPHLLADALYNLAQQYNSYYGSIQIIDQTDLKQTAARLLLAQAVSNRLTAGLAILGIAAPTRL